MDGYDSKYQTVEELTKRVNELYHKSQAEGLTEEEKAEQAELRKAYVAKIRNNLRGQLDHISIVEKDGSVTNLGEKFGKKKIRRQILSLRDQIPPALREEKSLLIAQTLFSMQCYQQADVLLVYVDYQSEVVTAGIIDKALAEGKQVFVPKVTGDDMEFYRIFDRTSLVEGYRGIREPSDGQIFSVGPDQNRDQGTVPLMLMPGTVFDRARHRIGYGKGFYDRYLHRLTQAGMKIYTAALCFACQVVGQVPHEAHDIRPDMVVTENGTYQ